MPKEYSPARRTHFNVPPQKLKQKQLKSILFQVSQLQAQIQKLPKTKGKHYVDPYTKIGENPAHLDFAQN